MIQQNDQNVVSFYFFQREDAVITFPPEEQFKLNNLIYMAKQIVISYTGRLDLKDRKDSLLFMVTFIKGVAPRKFIGCGYYISMVAGKPNAETVKVTYTLLATLEFTK